jgi:hypothetical protein
MVKAFTAPTAEDDEVVADMLEGRRIRGLSVSRDEPCNDGISY